MAHNSEEELRRELENAAENVLRELKPSDDAVSRELFSSPPSCAKQHWNRLGDAVSRVEAFERRNAAGSDWISLRLDGHGFSKLIRLLRRSGAMSPGFSKEFVAIMQECCTHLMSQFNASIGFTQSDEMTVLIRPTSVVRNEQQPHMFNGRLCKVCTLASSTVTALFNLRMSELFASHSIPFEARYLATFDCRMGTFGSATQAFGVLMWRAYDTTRNGVSDACYQLKGSVPGAGAAVKPNTVEKLKFLAEHSALPLPDHQANGSFYCKRRVTKVAVDPRTQEPVECQRSEIQQQSGHILALALQGELLSLCAVEVAPA
mmetsp:Transcript_14145/g.31402  ORF Transcript_14145/g.31402 Transcript_14145/m.31402 type:complete len:318 (+) Transcript_14145:50-1003(+)|eukprot:CAMPEP_0204272222 /NCGR_PEP_ID=MMETSP0468-20130131/21966_1 /ASSEMBLY_ACC=CAM_ASM_000383 /TAXON_ID=2969 /ORGANISM="Oxyrrhis marina" /LENGTH=317 /DNA_ID=CAMNT_0051248045 /DNA_START=49 /DNA_END=1002 /DNA_ORIENTATION=+